eukprot:scaffold155060_cov47-Attheya_sp.AAC.1
MAPSTPTTTPNVTPLRSRLADDDNRKRKAIATPPHPTPPRTGLPDRRTAYATTQHGVVANPYASPKPKQKLSISLLPITPGSSAKKKRSSSAPPPSSRTTTTATQFSLPTAELYKPFRENDVSLSATNFIGADDTKSMDEFDSK